MLNLLNSGVTNILTPFLDDDYGKKCNQILYNLLPTIIIIILTLICYMIAHTVLNFHQMCNDFM